MKLARQHNSNFKGPACMIYWHLVVKLKTVNECALIYLHGRHMTKLKIDPFKCSTFFNGSTESRNRQDLSSKLLQVWKRHISCLKPQALRSASFLPKFFNNALFPFFDSLPATAVNLAASPVISKNSKGRWSEKTKEAFLPFPVVQLSLLSLVWTAASVWTVRDKYLSYTYFPPNQVLKATV